MYQLNWYMLPVDLQNDLPTLLALTQKDIFLEGYGGVRCTLQVFMKVTIHETSEQLIKFAYCLQILQKTCSYFIVLQRFY